MGSINFSALSPLGALEALEGQEPTSVAITLSAAQLSTLATEPVQILPAPGPGLAYFVWFANYNLIFGTTEYNNLSTVEIVQNSSGTYGTNTQVSGINLDGGANNFVTRPNAASAQTSSSAIDVPLFLVASSNPTEGNGTATLTVYYSVISAQ